ncbi:ABC-type Fe3+-hydroxamate transport system, periplasmic component [Geoglobus ahangari]|uniref:ABC-type Fe3+-hydroxamate transport system, periplasmic component n=1 Tax=Geoglobus ahangari TaxID=113653 RepID=A0A0F7IEV8_9EURY|nr:ABC transporter substrate-binding protein [Geoglobus ahangari]AKG91553.1 ABC-type Fe3+-hydroxamate transport system, periplasmic component [Geoglobus ahangari]
MKKLIIMLVLLAAIALSGCATEKEQAAAPTPTLTPTPEKTPTATPTPTPTPAVERVVVTDDFGHEVVINGTPERIVSLAPSNTEILFAIGAGDRVVGVTDYCNYPPEVVELKNQGKLTSVGGFSTVDVEKVISLDPDLVVASFGNGEEVIEVLRSYGIPVIATNPKDLDDVMKDILMIGRAVGEEQNATKLVEWMEEKIGEVKKKAEGYEERPTVAHILWNDPIYVSGNSTFTDNLIEIAGGVNAFDDIDGWGIVSYEDLVARNPDIIIVNSGTGMGGEGDMLYKWITSEFPDLSAVKNGSVYMIDSDIISRPSYRLVYALENISAWIEDWENR